MSHLRIAALVALLLVPALDEIAIGQALSVRSVGAVTWHANKFIGKTVKLKGFVLSLSHGEVLFSDEGTGAISPHDLPIQGPGSETLELHHRYLLVGIFVKDDALHSNGSPYHLLLTAQPTPADG